MSAARPLPAVERLFGGEPILSPRGDGWESGVTFNAADVLVTDPATVAALTLRPASEFPDGVVALHYRARPLTDPGYHWTRSSVGLSVHAPDLTPIRRLDSPVLSPGDHQDALDGLGCEDPRVAMLGGEMRMVYCGSRLSPEGEWRGSLMGARSRDGIAWTKTGFLTGSDEIEREGGFDARYFDNMGGLEADPDAVCDKDGVLFDRRIGGRVFLLHRPMVGPMDTWAVHLASADEPEGPYTDHGPLYRATPDPQATESWVGAGGVPVPLGEGRFLMVGHTGHRLAAGERRYVLDAFLLDFARFDPARPEGIVVGRLDAFMVPETPFEIHGPFPDSVGNVIFSCGNHVHDGWLYIVYGGGDSFTLGARVRLDELVAAIPEAIPKA